MHFGVNKPRTYVKALNMESTTLFAVIVAVSNAIVAIFTYIIALHNSKHDKQVKKEQKIDEANASLEDVCNHGTISDLIDATKKIGEAKQ